MDLKQLRAFLTVAETGNVTRASIRLNLVQPAVSRQLRLLEEDIGTPLFERGPKGMTLTREGRTMVEFARRILNEVEKARAEIRPASAEVRGIVSVGLLASTSELLAPELVSRIATVYPDVKLRILVGYSGHLVGWLETGEVDAAIVYKQADSAALQVKDLLREQLWAVAPITARLRDTRKVTLREVATHPVVMPSAPQGLRTLIEEAAASADVRIRIAAETNSLELQRNLVKEGRGWTILPLVAVAREVGRAELCAAPITPTLARDLVLAISSRREATTPVRCVVAELWQTMQRLVAEGAWPSSSWMA